MTCAHQVVSRRTRRGLIAARTIRRHRPAAGTVRRAECAGQRLCRPHHQGVPDCTGAIEPSGARTWRSWAWAVTSSTRREDATTVIPVRLYADGGDPFAGDPKKVNAARYLAGGTPFGPPGDPNTPVSRNLTPRANGLPANLTWEQFFRHDANRRRPETSPAVCALGR